MYLKKLIFLPLFLMALFLPTFGNAEPLASVGYIHSEILAQKNLTIPIDAPVEGDDISSVKYMFKQIDIANAQLNGVATTDYANSAGALMAPVIASRAAADINALIAKTVFDEQIFEIDATSGTFIVPTRGYSNVAWDQPYSWEIAQSSDGGTNWTVLGTYSGTSSATAGIILSGLSTSATLRLRIRPTDPLEPYGWFRAFAFGADVTGAGLVANKVKLNSVLKTTSLRAVSIAENSTGNFFNAYKYNGCTALTTPEDTSNWIISGAQGDTFNGSKYKGCAALTMVEDTSAWTIFGAQDQYFNHNKYNGCTLLTAPEDTSGWTISGIQASHFSQLKYFNCIYLTTPEDTSGWTISGMQGELFNSAKYRGCTALTTPENTTNWTISGVQGPYFNQNKYSGCANLGTPENTTNWTISGVQPGYFNTSKYQGCTSLTAIEDWSNFGNLTTTATTGASWLGYLMYSITAANTTMTGVGMNTINKLNGGTLPYPIAIFTNRTGLSDYSTLPANAK